MEHPDQLARPSSKSALFWAFSLLALQGFGGVLALVQREMVERRRWLSNEQFLEDWAVAQIMPGPNAVNLSLMVGGRFLGAGGAAAAVAGMLALPLCIMLLLVVLVSAWVETPAVHGALRGLGAVAAGLIAGTGLKMLGPLRKNPMGLPVCAALVLLGFVMVGVLRWQLGWVLLGLAPLVTALAARAIRRQAHATPHPGPVGSVGSVGSTEPMP